MINYCFEYTSLIINIDRLQYSKPLPQNFRQSNKYKLIMKTISIVGLIEPVIVFFDTAHESIKIVDGHLRVEALKELGENKVNCLISTVYDTYTPNSKVNRTTIIQEYKMIQKAIDAGVTIEKLSLALDMSLESLKGKITILDGITPEVVSMFANLAIPKGTFYVLKKMKPMAQIENANLMIQLDNFQKKFALSLLHNTPPGLLVNGDKNQQPEKEGHRHAIQRLEKELAQFHVETEKLKDTYGVNALRLVIIKSHIEKLLNNPRVLHWLLDNKADHLTELKKISNIRALEGDEKKED
ncbi:hypothetical protein DT73_09745 [Mangrovibacter sp. MFB070]|uniref:ParB/RepB/Spo0J family partition protein n=1 Tax=Mangrovibacter sp. MFB070 TaxID=1224318 RepID=UPI0004DACCCB|nr:plasmid partitioning protein RepB C-terminal domain-containing protein [Mangrovibacter sp. MFB070]KEA53008.1 hypothetical protein DT73_09745 [Mangrovibacter sp. MFB070]